METRLISRRALIRGGLAVGAALGVAGTVRLPPVASGYTTFSWREIEILGAISDAMFPAGPVLISGRDAGVVEEVDRIIGTGFPPLHAMGFRYLLRTLEWGTVATFGTSFSRLSVEDARAVLDSWGDPGLLPRRIASDVLRTVFGMAYFANREVQRAMEWRSLCGSGAA
jgi:hypothetical protein